MSKSLHSILDVASWAEEYPRIWARVHVVGDVEVFRGLVILAELAFAVFFKIQLRAGDNFMRGIAIRDPKDIA